MRRSGQIGPDGPCTGPCFAASSDGPVDIRKPRRPHLHDVADRSLRTGAAADTFVHRASGHEFRLHRWERRGEEAIREMPKLGVFFYRGDHPVEGEGSSGILWLGGDLFSRVLALLVPVCFWVGTTLTSCISCPRPRSRP